MEDRIGVEGIAHPILMVDELKVEERLRWDAATNLILRLCREHSKQFLLQFTSEDEPRLIMQGLEEQTTRLAVEVKNTSSHPFCSDSVSCIGHCCVPWFNGKGTGSSKRSNRLWPDLG
jgi:hypothetical protein